MFEMLANIIADLLAKHRELLELSIQKKEYIIHNKIELLSNCTKQEGTLVKEIRQIEQERISQMHNLVPKLGASETTTLQELVDLIQDSNWRQQFSLLLKELQEVVSQILHVNQLNQKLIQDALGFVQDSIELFTDSGDPMNYAPTYKEMDQARGRTSSGLFDSKA